MGGGRQEDVREVAGCEVPGEVRSRSVRFAGPHWWMTLAWDSSHGRMLRTRGLICCDPWAPPVM